jgi:hypothetical protein
LCFSFGFFLHCFFMFFFLGFSFVMFFSCCIVGVVADLLMHHIIGAIVGLLCC